MYSTDMSTAAQKLITQALDLPPALRAFLAEKLIESLDAQDVGPISTKWRREIRRRCAEIDGHRSELRDANKVFARAYASLA
jgi:hypothetical protein